MIFSIISIFDETKLELVRLVGTGHRFSAKGDAETLSMFMYTDTKHTHAHGTREHARSTYTEHTRLSQDSETNGSTTNKGSEVKNLPTQETQV